MSYVLFDIRERGIPHVIKRYETHKGALIGMRAANRNAGWTRHCLTKGGIVEQEWCYRMQGSLKLHDYASYVIAHEVQFEDKYGLNQLVQVHSLMTGDPVMIHRRNKGTCLDPSQERYWSQ